MAPLSDDALVVRGGQNLPESFAKACNMVVPRVYADFQNLDESNRLRLNCDGTFGDLERRGIALREGLTLSFYTDDADDEGRPTELTVEGKVHYDPDAKCWVASVDWNALRQVPVSE